KIGALGRLEFPKGKYLYVGSAQTNLEKRIERHLTKRKKKFWHIDYLLCSKFAKVVEIFYKEAKKAEECKTAQTILRNLGGEPILKFGCSDCKCKAHLFRMENLNLKKLVANGWKRWQA
ncbi:MAG: GIY-YIG nuclease family protein, partial [Candidatus Diapherotrites archaeon]|nr:GIY-YIG nuclease family protein [Candidatus Diapherotrites archaeon]